MSNSRKDKVIEALDWLKLAQRMLQYRERKLAKKFFRYAKQTNKNIYDMHPEFYAIAVPTPPQEKLVKSKPPITQHTSYSKIKKQLAIKPRKIIVNHIENQHQYQHQTHQPRDALCNRWLRSVIDFKNNVTHRVSWFFDSKRHRMIKEIKRKQAVVRLRR